MSQPTLSLLAALTLVIAGCSDRTTNLVNTDGGGADAIDANVTAPEACGDDTCACDNGEDDDDDGLIDGLDPECTGPKDNDEKSFATGIPGSDTSLCKDCFFDDNADSEDDDCSYSEECMFGGSPVSDGEMSCLTCEITQQCIDSCRPRTPNGCDCFGCCGVTQGDGSVVNVILGARCSIKKSNDEKYCTRCVQHPTCRNDCGVCERCPGKKQPDLPDTCTTMPNEAPAFSCDEGEQTCDQDRPCPEDYYCHQGCCLFVLF